jgi:DHA1 family multidrug resistance protein-like MFS transporter
MEMHPRTLHEANPVAVRVRSQRSAQDDQQVSLDGQRNSISDEACSAGDRDPEKDAVSDGGAVLHPSECTCGRDPGNDLVEFDGPNDPGNPKNWPKWRKWAITVSMGLMTFAVTFSSSIFSVAVAPVAEEFHISTVASTFGVALFLFVRHGGVLWP